MKQKDFTPLQAIQHMRAEYEAKRLTRQNGGTCFYFCDVSRYPCIIGSLLEFTEEEKEGLVTRINTDECVGKYGSSIVDHEGLVCGIPCEDLHYLQICHDDMKWKELEYELDRLERMYGGAE